MKKYSLQDLMDNEELTDYQIYKKYTSPACIEWNKVKDFALSRCNHKCQCCGRYEDETTLCVHHNSYENLYDELNHPEDIIVLCKVCHKAIHLVKANISRFRKP